MNFTSPEFLLFFPVVLVLYYFLPVRARWGLLLAASWTFYLSWNPWTGILLILATACSYAAGRTAMQMIYSNLPVIRKWVRSLDGRLIKVWMRAGM